VVQITKELSTQLKTQYLNAERSAANFSREGSMLMPPWHQRSTR